MPQGLQPSAAFSTLLDSRPRLHIWFEQSILGAVFRNRGLLEQIQTVDKRESETSNGRKAASQRLDHPEKSDYFAETGGIAWFQCVSRVSDEQKKVRHAPEEYSEKLLKRDHS
jgi:hypothetical protein